MKTKVIISAGLTVLSAALIVSTFVSANQQPQVVEQPVVTVSPVTTQVEVEPKKAPVKESPKPVAKVAAPQVQEQPVVKTIDDITEEDMFSTYTPECIDQSLHLEAVDSDDMMRVFKESLSGNTAFPYAIYSSPKGFACVYYGTKDFLGIN